MAKYERSLTGNYEEFLSIVENGILEGSASASYEDGSDFRSGDVRCAVRVFERYSMMGGNRVSLNLTLFGVGNNLMLSAITSGGSQALFLKLNTFGEEAFLDRLVDIVEDYTGGR